jgi:hypothetical protein
MPGDNPADLTPAIERNRDALVAIVASLFAMLDFVDGTILERIPKGLSNAVLRILRPAESSVRRLIVVMAWGLVAEPPKPRNKTEGKTTKKDTGSTQKSRAPRIPAFKLTDHQEPLMPPPSKRKKPGRAPRISVLGGEPSLPDWSNPDLTVEQLAVLRAAQAHQPAPQPEPRPRPEPKPRLNDGCVGSARLARRLLAIKAALEDLPRQAKRLARWKAKRQRQWDEGRYVRTSPLREADRSKIKVPANYRPPSGYRDPVRRAAENIFHECDWLAREAMRIDTS